MVVASGPAETIRTKHRFSDERMGAIMQQISTVTERIPKVLNTIICLCRSLAVCWWVCRSSRLSKSICRMFYLELEDPFFLLET